MDIVTIESHYELQDGGNAIKAYTRNQCSEDLVEILNEIANILYPDEEFDAYLLPPEAGSYKDVIRFVQKNKQSLFATAAAPIIIAAGALYYQKLSYDDSHEQHVYDQSRRPVEEAIRCIEYKKVLDDQSSLYGITGPTRDQADAICKSVTLKRLKNNKYQTLIEDGTVESEETIVKDQGGKVLINQKFGKADFPKLVEPIDKEGVLVKELHGTIDLYVLVIKQLQFGKGRPWIGTYYGNDVVYDNKTIIANNTEISFYMQDEEFKEHILRKTVSFISGDKLGVVFDIRIEPSSGALKNIYVNRVIEFNGKNIESIYKKTIDIRKPEDINDLFYRS